MQSGNPMSRTLCLVLSALVLVLNGISAPWAMARMSHADLDRADSEAPLAAVTEDGQEHCAHGSVDADHDSTQTSGSGSVDKPNNGTCCDDVCKCGCVAPPGVVFNGLPARALMGIDAPAVPIVRHRVVRTTKPPFRPPAA